MARVPSKLPHGAVHFRKCYCPCGCLALHMTRRARRVAQAEKKRNKAIVGQNTHE